MAVSIRIPKIVAEANLARFIETLGTGNGHAHIRLDLSASEFMVAGGIVALTAKVAAWEAEGAQVEFVNYEACPAFRYLQRINLFHACGYDLPEPFRRHDPNDRFVPIEQIGIVQRSDPSKLGNKVARVILGSEEGQLSDYDYDAFKYLEYAVSEVAANVLHHSGGTGYVSAQYYPTRAIVRVGIADSGVGIRESFQGSRFDREGMTDSEAVALALRPLVSSKLDVFGMYGDQRNFGVGLSLLKALVERTHGDFLVLSGTGYYGAGGERNIREDFGFKGTVCAFSFPRDAVDDFANLLYQVKVDLGLIDERRGDHAEMFR